MRMKLATAASMDRFLQCLLAHPQRFARSEAPCCLQDLGELALEDLNDPLADDHMRGTSRSLPMIHRVSHFDVN